MNKKVFLLTLCVFVAACAGPKVIKTQPLSANADAPYDNVLVVSLFESFDRRMLVEREIVLQLTAKGINAVASTSMMKTTTPVVRQTFVDMVKKLNSDAVLVTQLASVDTSGTVKGRNPEATYKVRPTGYYNIWTVNLTEYVEPPMVELKYDVQLATVVYSASTQEPVWAIQSESKITQSLDQRNGAEIREREVRAIMNALARDGLLAKQ